MILQTLYAFLPPFLVEFCKAQLLWLVRNNSVNLKFNFKLNVLLRYGLFRTILRIHTCRWSNMVFTFLGSSILGYINSLLYELHFLDWWLLCIVSYFINLYVLPGSCIGFAWNQSTASFIDIMSIYLLWYLFSTLSHGLVEVIFCIYLVNAMRTWFFWVTMVVNSWANSEWLSQLILIMVCVIH